MEIVLASNFDNGLVERLGDLPVTTLFGNFAVSLTGGGRPARVLPQVDPDRFRAHVAKVHAAGRKFYATMNTGDLALKEYSPGFSAAFSREVAQLLDLGVDGFVVSLPILVEAIRNAHATIPISVSAFARIRSVTQGEYFLRLGADTIVIEEGNRDFRLLQGLVRLGARVEVLVNQTCIPGCPFRAHHLNTISLSGQPEHAGPALEYPLLECGLEMVRDPATLIQSEFVRPEDLAFFEERGIARFKIAGRNRSTDWLLRAASAYAARRYDGNLLDLLSLVQLKGPYATLKELGQQGADPSVVEPLSEAFRALRGIRVDNSAFPEEFIRRVAAHDCEHVACSECGYCASVAQKVVTIDGRPLSEYRPPERLPNPVQLLPLLATPEPHAPTSDGSGSHP